jgi:hypothetical protein
MYQSIITFSIIFSTSLAFSSTKEITKIYEDFNKQKNEFLKADLNKKNIKDLADSYFKKLQSLYDQIKDLEAKDKKDVLTPEGNEVAYDLETLQPIKLIAKGLITKEDCFKARHEHELNFPVAEDETSKAIENIFNKICNSI